jgi:uncharacterized membrane protein YciS (DUF1049 family)
MSVGGIGGWELLIILFNCGIPVVILVLAFVWLKIQLDNLHKEQMELRQQVEEIKKQLGSRL